MRRGLFLVALLCFSAAAWASTANITFQNNGGKISTNGSTLSLTGSTLTSFSSPGLTASGTLGTVSFTTGSLMAGTLGGGGTFNGGGSFTIKGNGTNGLPNGFLFQGSFSGPVAWSVTFDPAGFGGKGAYLYTLTGNVFGTLNSGFQASGATVQFTFDVPKGQTFASSVKLNYGTTIVPVPEPGTLGLLGTGLVGLAAALRKRF